MQPAAVALFGAGLLLVVAAGVLAALALWRGGNRPRWAGIPLAVALVLYLPQYFGSPALRTTHGALAAAALALVAYTTARAGDRSPGLSPAPVAGTRARRGA